MGSGSISSMEPEGPRDYEVIRKLNLPPFLCLFCAIRKLNLTPFLPFCFFAFFVLPFLFCPLFWKNHLMNTAQQKHSDALYRQHTTALIRQGKNKAII
jgi:hypothetical protein